MANPTALLLALDNGGDPPLHPLPASVASLLRDLNAPPRLAAHLRAVHDVACQLLDWLSKQHPESAVGIDREAVAFGAATHDIGKTLHLAELTGLGSAHEEAGRELLLAHGVSPELSRFAATHASWDSPGVNLEDLLVSLADKIWKNKRVAELEDLIVTRLAAGSGRPTWEEFLALDEALTRMGDGADARLAFQNAFPVHG